MNAPTLFPLPAPSTTLPAPPSWPAQHDIGPGWWPLAQEAERLLRTSGIRFDGELRYRNRYGQLWLVGHYCSPEVRVALKAQEPALQEIKQRSRQTCEVCGQPGEPTPSKQRWVNVLCPAHLRARRSGATWEALMGYRPRNVPIGQQPDSGRVDAPTPVVPPQYPGAALHALCERWRALSATLMPLVPEVAQAYRCAAGELESACGQTASPLS